MTITVGGDNAHAPRRPPTRPDPAAAWLRFRRTRSARSSYATGSHILIRGPQPHPRAVRFAGRARSIRVRRSGTPKGRRATRDQRVIAWIRLSNELLLHWLMVRRRRSAPSYSCQRSRAGLVLHWTADLIGQSTDRNPARSVSRRQRHRPSPGNGRAQWADLRRRLKPVVRSGLAVYGAGHVDRQRQVGRPALRLMLTVDPGVAQVPQEPRAPEALPGSACGSHLCKQFRRLISGDPRSQRAVRRTAQERNRHPTIATRVPDR